MSESRDFELKAKERIVLSALLPNQGDIVTLRLVLDLRKDLSFTPDEHKELGIISDGASVRWDEQKDVGKTISIPLVSVKLIQAELQKLNAARTLTVDQVLLYDVFMDPTKA